MKMWQALQQYKHRPLCFSTRLLLFARGPGSLFWAIALPIWAVLYNMGLSDLWIQYVRFPVAEMVEVRGTVIFSDDTNLEINDRTVSVIAYKYLVDGLEFEGFSFGRESYPAKGSKVTVQYIKGDPAISHIKGKYYYKFQMMGLIFATLALILTFFALLGSRKNWLWQKLLVDGEVANARLEKKEATNVSVNKQTVYRYIYVYKDKEGAKQRTEIKTHDDSKIQENEELFFFPGKDKRVLLFSNLTVQPDWNEGGRWLCNGFVQTFLAWFWKLLIPVFIVFIGTFF